MSAMSRGTTNTALGVLDAANTAVPISRATETSSNEIGTGDEAPTRQAMMRYAVDGLQRFKQSWKSVMLLKAGVGLGQVIVLIVLLILANFLSSPLFPSQSQVIPSDACPHPQLFQAWMGVQIARLTICWSVSCWICIRTERARERRRRQRELEDGDEGPCEMDEATLAATPGVVIAPADGSPLNPGHTNHNSTSTSRPNPPPSLVHSTSSTSTATLASMPASSSMPSTPHTSHFASSSRLDLTRVPETEFEQDNEHKHEAHEMVAKHPRGPVVGGEAEGLPVLSAESSLDVPRPRLTERPSMRSLRQARGMLRGEQPESSDNADQPAGGAAGWLDRHAVNISRSLGMFSFVLFLLGNILLFYPPPSSRSCYSANPLLWWGVLTVTAVGWVLLLQVFFVVVIVGLGGAVVVNALRRLGVIPAPIEPEPPRAAQPDPLTKEELAHIKVVCYVPAETPTEDKETPQAKSSFCATRLPYPPAYLSAHQASCAICQENFEAPKEGRTVLLKADKLRQLRCTHVYHLDCIDQWLLRGSGNCPACNAPVRDPASASPSRNARSASISRRRSILARGRRGPSPTQASPA